MLRAAWGLGFLMVLLTGCGPAGASRTGPETVAPAAPAEVREAVSRALEEAARPVDPETPGIAAEPTVAPTPSRAPLETPRVVFGEGDAAQEVIVEVVDAPETRARGLMHRTSLPDGTGMIFVFPQRQNHSFWMKNTLIPLDMIFVDGDEGAERGVVVGIVHEAVPKTLTPRQVGFPSRWVVEVPGGWARKRGLTRGMPVRLLDMPPPSRR